MDSSVHANHYLAKYKGNIQRFENFFYNKCPKKDNDKFCRLIDSGDGEKYMSLPTYLEINHID